MNNTTLLKSKIYHLLDDFQHLQHPWQALLKNCPESRIFQTWAWHNCWLSTFKSDVKLWVVTLWQQQQLIAIAPLYLDNKKVLHFIGTSNQNQQATDYANFICHPDYPQALPQLLDVLLQNKSAWHELRLHNFYQNSPEYQKTLPYLDSKQPYYLTEFLYDSPSRILGDADSDNKLLNYHRFRRLNNWFNRQGKLTYHHLTDKTELLAQLPHFFKQHQQRWNPTSTPSKFNQMTFVDFFQKLVTTFSDIKGLRLSYLTLDGEPIAYDCSLFYENYYIYYTPCYNLQYAKRSAGFLLHQYLLRYLIDNKIKACDYSIGSESYKYRLSNEIHKVYQVRVFSKKYHYYLANIRNTIRQWLHQQPRLHHLVCQLRGVS